MPLCEAAVWSTRQLHLSHSNSMPSTLRCWTPNASGHERSAETGLVPPSPLGPEDFLLWRLCLCRRGMLLALATKPLLKRVWHAACAEDGVVYAWGNNSYGQLGDMTITSRSLPAVVHVE